MNQPPLNIASANDKSRDHATTSSAHTVCAASVDDILHVHRRTIAMCSHLGSRDDIKRLNDSQRYWCIKTMGAVDPTYPLYPIACIIAAALLFLVLLSSFVRQSWNLGVAFLCFWLLLETLTGGIDAIIWSDNADIKMYVYCDIGMLGQSQRRLDEVGLTRSD